MKSKMVPSINIPESCRNVANNMGEFTHWVWFYTGNKKPRPGGRPIRPVMRQVLGVEYGAEALPRPVGDCAAGQWSATRPTGAEKLCWD